MKLYLFNSPLRSTRANASFSHIGTWDLRGLCKGCHRSLSQLMPPLQIEWDPGFNSKGSFAWCGYTCIVHKDVAAQLEQLGLEFSFEDVLEFEAKSRIKHLPQISTLSEYRWLRPVEKLSLNEELSRIKVVQTCPACGLTHYEFKRFGLFLDAADWGGSKVFQFEQHGNSGAIYMSEEGADLLRSSTFTNFELYEAGYILEA
jgi:hypothetical protein